jgi:hypothetical protein
MSNKQNKRKRENDDAPVAEEKAKRARKEARKVARKAKKEEPQPETPVSPKAHNNDNDNGQKDTPKLSNTPHLPPPNSHASFLDLEHRNAVSKKITSMSPRKYAWYQARADAKHTTVYDIILKRVKKASAKTSKWSKKARKAAAAPKTIELQPDVPFFTDLSGDITLKKAGKAQATLLHTLQVREESARVAEAAEARGQEVPLSRTAAKKAAKEAGKRDVTEGVGGYERGEKEAFREERKEKKKIKQEEKALRRGNSTSKCGDKKSESRWGKLEAEKKAAKEAAVVADSGGNAE